YQNLKETEKVLNAKITNINDELKSNQISKEQKDALQKEKCTIETELETILKEMDENLDKQTKAMDMEPPDPENYDATFE
ncbi:unnamed protein product, partial [Didymodactylos carnosus]